MNKAIDFIIKNPVCVDANISAIYAINTMLRSEAKVICITENGIAKNIISPVSVTIALAKRIPINLLNASNVGFKVCPKVDPSSDLETFLPALRRNGVLAVLNEKKEINGILTYAQVVSIITAQLIEKEKELCAVINCSSDEIVMTDGEGKVLRANAVFEENFGVKLTSFIGNNVEELEKNKTFFPSAARVAIENKSTQTVVQTHVDGRKLLATGTPAFNNDNTIFRVIVNTRDITKLNQLKQRYEETELLKNRYKEELIELNKSYMGRSNMVASSPAMTNLIDTVKKIAAVDSTILLTGESGTGKGMIAHYIHNHSTRSDKPFTVVSCGAIPENLLESELFGYDGGAFTGAKKEGKIGKLELADEGTVFFDEIAELPINLQVKLLQVIQEGIICRIGGTNEIKLNLRFIAATNRDLDRIVEEGKFREDLFYRLNVIPLFVPPLRERREDIKPLIKQAIEEFSCRYDRHKYFTDKAYEVLEQYHWPGNIRELQNLIERMMIVVDSDEIALKNLPRHLFNQEVTFYNSLLDGKPLKPLKIAREEIEKELLTEALRRHRTTYEIAEALEVDQSTIVRKLNKYKIKPNVKE